MATSWPKLFVGQGRKVYRTLCLCMVIFTVLDRSVPVMATIEGLHKKLTARIGDIAKIPFEFCEGGAGKPSCTIEHTFNLSAPNPLCTANHRHGHCQINAASEDHPGRPGLYNQHECELCELTVQGATQEDRGQYSICRLPGCVWQSLTLLEIENDTTPKSSTSEPVSTTKPGPADLSSSVSTTIKLTTNESSKIILPGTEEPGNDPRIGMKTSSAIGVTIVLVILIICGAFYLYKRQSRRRQNVYYTPAAVSPSTNGPMATVTINMKSADGSSNSENAHLKEDPNCNT